MADRLQEIRDAINSLDRQLVDLLNERAQLVGEVGQIKRQTGAPIFQPEREAEVIRRVTEASRDPMPPEALAAIYREIMAAARLIQKPLSVAYLGPQGTFSELATQIKFGHVTPAVPFASIDEVFRAAESGQTDFAMVPIENSSEGAVSRSLDLLLSTSLNIVAEVSVPVRLHLLTPSGTLDGITQVFGHSQVLGQCVGWLNQNLPGVARVAVASNGEAARLAGERTDTAAIAGEQAGERYGLVAVHTNIQDDPHNRTRFVVLGKGDTKPSGRDKTSFIMSVANRAGAVYQMLAPLAQHAVSMTRFESRPARTGAWEYHFYVDVEGHASDPAVAAVIHDLQQACAYFRCLGSYPRDA
jgi:chorismate mutase/prephenate dehydratase